LISASIKISLVGDFPQEKLSIHTVGELFLREKFNRLFGRDKNAHMVDAIQKIHFSLK
jgi:hypothetical protein